MIPDERPLQQLFQHKSYCKNVQGQAFIMRKARNYSSRLVGRPVSCRKMKSQHLHFPLSTLVAAHVASIEEKMLQKA